MKLVFPIGGIYFADADPHICPDAKKYDRLMADTNIQVPFKSLKNLASNNFILFILLGGINSFTSTVVSVVSFSQNSNCWATSIKHKHS